MTAANRRLRQAGFTLIEIMIALLIGLIGIVVMMQTFAVSEGFKRTSTSGTDAQVNGAVALYILEREIRMAGYGMNSLMQEGCPYVRVWNSSNGTGFDMRMVPFEINPAGVPAGDANTDTILISYGQSDSFVSGIPADQPNALPTENFVFAVNRDTFKNGDRFVSVMPGVGPGGLASCVLHEVTQAPGAAGNCGTSPPPGPVQLVHAAASYKSFHAGCATVAAKYNASTGIRDAGGTLVPPVRGPQGQIFNLGVTVFKVYAVRDGNLTFCDWAITDCTIAANYTVVVSDIVSMRVMYGMNLTPSVSSNPGDGNVTWTRAPLTGDVFLPSRVHAVAMQITARSGVREKPTSGTTCDATTVASRPDRAQDWMYQSTTGAGIDISASSPDWRCYRYKLFQTAVPLRNLLWRP